MAKEAKLDVFQALAAMDRRDFGWLDRQPAERKKEFQPVVVTRWAAGAEDGASAAYALWVVNERVNLHMFDLSRHPDLVFRLLASCGTGKLLRHKWVAGKTHRSAENRALALMQELYPDANSRESEMLLSQHSRESFAALVDDLGRTLEDAKELLKHYEKFHAKVEAQDGKAIG